METKFTGASEKRIHECTVLGCEATTTEPSHPNPRFRWAIFELPDDDGVKIVKLCPEHVREILPVDDDFFERVERTEKFIQKEAVN